MALNVRQQRFVDGIIAGKTQAQAYKDAGYKASDARRDSVASELAHIPQVSEEIARRRAKVEAKVEITVESILLRLNQVAERCMQEDAITGRIDSSGANRALELLGKHKRMFIDRVEHSADADLAQALAEARERAKGAG